MKAISAFDRYTVFVEHIVPSFLFSRLLSETGQLLGMPSLAPSSEGVCQLAFDGRHLVQIVDVRARDHILLSCFIGSEKITAEQAMLVASSNFMQAAGGAVACATPDGRLMLQFGIARTACQASLLLSAIEALLNQVETWEAKLSRATMSAHNSRDFLALKLSSA